MENSQLQLFTNEGLKIKSTELVEIINEFRKVESEASEKKYVELQHKSFITKIETELKTLETLGLRAEQNILLSQYLDKNNQSRKCYELNRDGMLMMLNSESTLVRLKTIEYINTLEKKLNPVDDYLQMSEEDRAILYFTKLKEAKKLETDNKEKDKLLLKAGEKTTIVDEFLGSKGLYGVDVVSKTLAIKGMGRNNFYDYLRQHKIMMTDTYFDKKGNKKAGARHYEIYAKYVNDQQYFAHRTRKVQAGFKTIEQLVGLFTPKGIEWIINGRNIPGDIEEVVLKDIDFAMKLYTNNVPEQLVENMPEADRLQLSLDYNGSFGFSAILKIPMGMNNSGRIANLFYYNPVTKKLELQSVGRIQEDGEVELQFSHASDYVIVMNENAMLEKAMDEITVMTAKNTIYLGGTKGKSLTLNVVTPNVIKKAVTDELCNMSITHKSSKPKVASISASGKIIAKKAGKTTITTTITINGVKKNIRNAIIVKKANKKPR
jgi:phage antirepressor YoqD-like protein